MCTLAVDIAVGCESGHDSESVDIIVLALEAAGLHDPEGLECVPRWWNW